MAAALLLLLLCPSPPTWAAQAGAYDLFQAVERALAENFRIVAAEADVAATESSRKGSLSAFGPNLQTTYGASRQEHANDDVYSWRLALTQNLFAGFSTLASYQKAALQKDNAESRLQQARLNLILQVQQNFLLYLKAEENVRSALDSYNRLAEQLKVTRSFHEVGLRPRVEVLQAEVNVSEAEDLLLKSRNTVETQRVRLNTLLNIPVGREARYVGSLEHIPFSLSPEQCLEKAYKSRPDVRMAEKSVRIAEKDLTIARSSFWPSLSASASWNANGDTWKVGWDKERPQDYRSWSVGLSATWDLFSSGSDYFRTGQAGHSISRLKAEETTLRQEVVYEVQSRLLDLENARERIAVARKGLEQALEAYQVAAARYKSQVGTAIDVLDAQSRLTAAEVSLTGAQADYLSSLAAVYAAIGEENPGLRPK
ncbi:MAG: TolC family protein [Deltaproteobacteria bacterium]|nr:TolC family protein [Deltaproteobacteria bacterium]